MQASYWQQHYQEKVRENELLKTQLRGVQADRDDLADKLALALAEIEELRKEPQRAS